MDLPEDRAPLPGDVHAEVRVALDAEHLRECRPRQVAHQEPALVAVGGRALDELLGVWDG